MDETAHLHTLQRTDPRETERAIEALVNEAERRRLFHMRRRRSRSYITTLIGMLCIMAGGAGFGWYFLVEADLLRALGCILIAVPVPFLLAFWSEIPTADYARDHRRSFMPAMAKVLGGLNYDRNGGISEKALAAAAVLPPFERVQTEDCFSGVYKGIQVLFCETRILDRKRRPVFEGLSIILELPHKIAEGHIILTANSKLADTAGRSRWAKLREIRVNVENPEWDRFRIFAEKPEDVSLVVGEKLLKELSEAASVFGGAPMTAAFVRGKYMVMFIPHKDDMFEASDNVFPVATKTYALARRREIEKILEIIDIFDIYKAEATTVSVTSAP